MLHNDNRRLLASEYDAIQSGTVYNTSQKSAAQSFRAEMSMLEIME
jgi:hypothetical protein